MGGVKVRPWTFFEEGVVGHVGFADPFDQGLREVIGKAVGKEGVLEGEGVKLHDGGTVVCIGTSIFSLQQRILFSSLHPPSHKAEKSPTLNPLQQTQSTNPINLTFPHPFTTPSKKPPQKYRRTPILHPRRIPPLPRPLQ